MNNSQSTLVRVMPGLVVTALLVGAAAIAVGPPDFGAAHDFLFSGIATNQTALAVASLLCWLLILVAAAVGLSLSLRTVAQSQVLQRRWTRATIFLTAGIISLTMGTLHHNTTGYPMCCGSQAQHLAEAQQLVQR